MSCLKKESGPKEGCTSDQHVINSKILMGADWHDTEYPETSQEFNLIIHFHSVIIIILESMVRLWQSKQNLMMIWLIIDLS